MKKLLLLFFVAMPFFSSAQLITTVAGIAGHPGYTGDGLAATSAEIHSPCQTALNNSGNLFFTDQCNNVVRKVNASGIITTCAGDGYMAGSCGSGDFRGDGGPALTAWMRSPFSVTVDASGNIYIGDDNNEVRKVNTSGIISDFAGKGPYFYGTDLPFNGEGGPATAAELIYPLSLAVDNLGYIYFLEGNRYQVRKISPTGIISTVAGVGTYGYSGDGGPATAAMFQDPSAIAVDNSGDVYIVDAGNQVVRKVSTSGIITNFAGNGLVGYSGDGGPATAAKLWDPSGVAVDASHNVYIAEKSSNNVRVVNSAGIISTFAGTGTGPLTYGYSGDNGAATAAQLFNPTNVSVDALGNVYISDGGNGVIRKVNVHVSPITGTTGICVGTTSTLSDVSPGATWSSSAPAVATVGATTGIVTGASVGTAIITHSTLSSFKITTVTVNPIPALSSTLTPAAICDSNLFSYFPVSTVTSTTFAWSRPARSGIQNHAATGTGNPMEYLDDTTAFVVSVPYIYTLSAAGCTKTDTVVVTVKPTPHLTGPLSFPAICDSSFFHYTAASATPGIVFYWSEMYNPAIISTYPGGGIDSISKLLINISTSLQIVNFQIALHQAGCTDDMQYVSVSVKPGPVEFEGYITGPSSACAGGTVTLADAAPGGVWSTTNTSASVSTSGILSGLAFGVDTVLYTVTNTCGTKSADFIVTIDTLPVLGPITGVPYVCIGTWDTLNCDPAGGTWTVVTGNANVVWGNIIAGLTPGPDTIIYSISNSCGLVTNSLSISVFDVAQCDSIATAGTISLDKNESIKIFPNPALNELSITFSGIIELATIYNSLGDVVFNKNYSTNSVRLSISNLPRGLYLIRINDHETWKFIKE